MDHLISFNIIDAIDIIIVSFLIYQILRFIKGTRATQIMVGIFLVFILALIANIFNFEAVSWILNGIKTVWLIAFVIVFQPEIRRALTMLGRTRFVKFFLKETDDRFISEIIDACRTLAENRWGGLIVIERKVGLKNYLERSVRLEADVSSDLITSIFAPKSPLHDGAIIIKDGHIIAAGCILPLSDNPNLDRKYGTRHRAGIGITEETDAIAIIVSEERGKISLAERGYLFADLDTLQLERKLTELIRY